MIRYKTLLSIALAVGAGALLIVMPEAGATAQRTFVASTGLDTNACSLTLDSAGYGSVTVTHSVSLIAPPGIYAGIGVFPGFDGVTVNAPGATVVLRGLSINGQGGNIGVNLLQAARLRIESCVISNMGGWGIAHRATGGDMIVLDTIVRDNLDSGIYVGATQGSVLLDHVRSERNVFEGFHITQNPGSFEAHATIVDSVFTSNFRNGVMALTVAGATTSVQLERSVLANNEGEGFGTTVGAAAGARVRATLTRNAISRNHGDGVLISAVAPGSATGNLSDNSVHESGGFGINADGSGAFILAGGNTVQSSVGGADLRCGNSAIFRSNGTNMAFNAISSSGCFLTGLGL